MRRFRRILWRLPSGEVVWLLQDALGKYFLSITLPLGLVSVLGSILVLNLPLPAGIAAAAILMAVAMVTAIQIDSLRERVKALESEIEEMHFEDCDEDDD